MLDQAETRQPGLQRGALDDGEKPGVKGADGDARLRRQHRFKQPARARQQAVDFIFRYRALMQKRAHRRVVGAGQQRQPVVQPGAHFACRLARESNRENIRWRHASQQQTQHARHQQPGFAAAGAGFDDDRVLRIEGGVVKRVHVCGQ